MCELKKYKGRSSNPRVDSCIDILTSNIAWLLIESKSNKKIVGSCCGHNKYPMTILIKNENGLIFDLVSNKHINRKKRFYKKDSKGYYYIPEVVECKVKNTI